MPRRKILSVFILSLILAAPCAAKDGFLGIYNSLKGFGLVIETTASNESFDEFGLYADIYGFPTGRATFYPGAKAFYLRNHILKTFHNEQGTCSIYAGAGAAAGYVHDFEIMKKYSEKTYLQNPMGICAAASGDVGLRAEFSGCIALDFSFELEAGMFAGKNESGSMVLGLYKNGLYQIIYPQLSILWKF